MRVLIISSSYFPHKGGLQQVVGRLAEGLSGREVPVSVIANKFPLSLPGHELIRGVDVWRFPFFAPDFTDFRQGRPFLYLSCYGFSVWTLLGFLGRMMRFRPDVVNVHFPLNQVPFYNLVRRVFPRVAVVVSLHGNDVEQYLSDNSQYQQDVRRQTERALHRLLQSADLITAPSRYLMSRAQRFHPVVAHKGCIIPNGISPVTKAPERPVWERPYLLGVGRLTYRKGFDLLLKAFIPLADAHPGLDLILLGDGEMRPELEAMLHQAGLDSRVHLLGWVPHSEVSRWMAGARLVVVPSRQEGFGMTALEAMAVGRPVVATRVGALPELLLPGGNLLVEPGVGALQKGLAGALSSRERMEDVGRKNRSLSRAYHWDTIITQYLDAYRGVLAD